MAAHRMHNEYLNVLYDAERQNLIKRRGVDALLLATYAEEVLPHMPKRHLPKRSLLASVLTSGSLMLCAGHVFHLTSCSVGLYVLELRYVLLVGADTGAHVGHL